MLLGVPLCFAAALLLKRQMPPPDTMPPPANEPEARRSQQVSLVPTSSTEAVRIADERRLDPQQDGWHSEVIAERAKLAMLKILGSIDGSTSHKELHRLSASTFSAPPLRPDSIQLYNDPTLTIAKGAPSADAAAAPLGNLVEALQPLVSLMTESTDFHSHVKVIRVEADGQGATTSAIVELDGRLPDGVLAVRAIWNCAWTGANNLRLTSITVNDHLEMRSTVGSQQTWFIDATASTMGNTTAFTDHLAYGLNYWLPRVERVHGMHAFARWGLAVGDADGDGLDDLYVCQPGGLPNRLLIRQPDGTVRDSAAESGVDYLDHTSSALLVDLDNDGDQDLALATASGLLVLANDGNAHFTPKATLHPDSTDFMSLSACDYDDDGDLDLFACIEFPQQGANDRSPFIYHDANDGAANALLRNDVLAEDTWSFADVTQAVGLDVNNRRHSLAAAWEDFDNDGDQDLYVANDYGQNCLYRNDGGYFEEVAPEANVVDTASGMSVTWGDYNHDGWMDLYVANMFSSAGNRITRQRQFRPDEDAKTRQTYQRFAKGNSLFANMEAEFTEVSAEANVQMGRWAWSSLFGDLNNDGWEDLVVANGYITTEDTGDL